MKLNKFAVIQGAFISVQKSLSSLSTIDLGDKESLDFVNGKISNAVKSEDFVNEDLQRLFLLLFLNTNTTLYQELKNDFKYTHIIGYIPMISRHVLAKLIFGLKLEPFLYNSIIFIEGKLCHQLLRIAEIYIKILDEFEAINFIENVIKAIYKKLSFSEDSQVKLSFHVFLKHYDDLFEERDRPKKWKKTKQFHFSGLVMYSLLSLLHEALHLYCDNDQEQVSCHEVFEIFKNVRDNTKTDYANKNSLLECCNLLISKCSQHAVTVTLEVYLYWAEVDLDDVPDTTNTLQTKIGEKAYVCITALTEAEKLGIFSSDTSVLISYLSSIASKPHIEKERELDIPTIIQNIKDAHNNPTEWIKKLLETNFEFDDDIVELLVMNILFLDFNDRRKLFKKCIEFADNTTECSEYIKQLALNIISQEEIDYQVKLLEDFVRNYGLKKILMLNEFKKLCTETFNKVVCESDETKRNEMNCNFISLAIQDGETVIVYAVKEAVNSELQAKLMAEILNILSPVCWWSSKKDENNELSLLIHSLKNMFQEIIHLPDHCKIYFPCFVSELLKRKLVDKSVLMDLLIQLLSNINIRGNPEEVTLYSVGLDLIMEVVKLGTKTNNSHILALLVDILHENRCYIQYCFDKMMVCEKAISLIDLIVNDCIRHPENFSVVEKVWLKNKVKNYKKINTEHLARLFPEDDRCPDDLADSLFHMMHRDTERWSVLALDVESRSNTAIAMTSMLVSMTRSEWLKMFNKFAPDNAHFTELFLIVSEAICLAKAVFDSCNCIDSGQVNLEYCILNAGCITHEMMTLWDGVDPESTANVFFKICLIIQELSAIKQEECSFTLMKTLIELLEIIAKNKPIEGNTMSIIMAGVLSLNVVQVRRTVAATFVKLMNS